MKNTDKRNLIISLLVGLAGVLLIVIPAVGWVDIYEGGGAMIMLGALLALTGPIVSLLFWHRAKLFDQLMNPENLLAHWQYDRFFWQSFAEDEVGFRAGEQRGMQLIVLFFSVLFGGIFWWADPESGWIVAVVLLGVNLLIAGIVWLNTRRYTGWKNDENVECRIGQDGLIINRQFHVWRGWGARPEEIKLSRGKINMLEIVYSTPNRYSRQYTTIRVPIPPDKLSEGEELAKKLTDNDQ